jgi:hypothetical protein
LAGERSEASVEMQGLLLLIILLADYDSMEGYTYHLQACYRDIHPIYFLPKVPTYTDDKIDIFQPLHA